MGYIDNLLSCNNLQGHKNDENDEVAFRKSFINKHLKLGLVETSKKCYI